MIGRGKRRELGCEVKLLLFLVAVLVAVTVLRELGITVQDAMKQILAPSGL